MHQLPWKTTLSGNTWEFPEPPATKSEKSNKRKYTNILSLDKAEPLLHQRICAVQSPHNNDIDTLPCIVQVDDVNGEDVAVRALIDSRALHGDYINTELASKLQRLGARVRDTPSTICNAFGECKNMIGQIDIKLKINFVPQKLSCSCTHSHTENDMQSETLTLCCTIIQSPYELIIGRPTIQQHNLLLKLHSHLMQGNRGDTRLVETRLSREPIRPRLDQYLASVYRENQSTPGYIRATMRQFLKFDPEAEGISYPYAEQDPYTPDRVEIENQIPTHIHGSVYLRKALTDLCMEYLDIFSTKVRQQPADIPPFEIKCDLNKWHIAKNRGAPRMQTPIKQAETIRQINEMLRLNVIQKSNASAYSQVHLVPKPNSDKWRFCVDYRRLNDCCEKSGWPIPNIKLMFARIGNMQPQPRFYGKIDLTSGYHQAPLSAASSALTAFITISGVYEWLRVPMGPKGAPSYFQQMIASVVLLGLLYVICEAYLDDVLVFGDTEDELVKNLRQIFDRFRKHKLTINPEKCELGMQEVVFVGHLLSAKGITFTRERIDAVLSIPPPKYEKDMKKFLGVINYFHDHIRDHSMLAKPLQQMILQYTPSKQVVWSEDALVAFEKLKESINQCPTLSFINDTAPIILNTDASDYAIGAYLYQVIDGKEVPVAFMSRALDERECGWCTAEKECYAIYYALVKFEYLLRDTHFIIRTDHKNLTYLNDSVNRKVNNWKLKIQHFNFDIEYIPGEENVVADGFSRIVASMHNKTKENNNTGDEADNAEYINIIDELKLDDETYTKISTVHNSQAGHHGVERTCEMLARAGQRWFKMREHVKKFIKQCPACQKMSVLRTPIHTHPFTTAAYEPMERVNVDSIGPLTPDEKGNKYIIVIIDCFTRFVELYAAPDATAIAAATALLQHMGRYGCAHQILSDNGSQYVNEIISKFTELVGTEHVRTLAYSHEENSIVERANKEVIRHLRAMLFDKNIKHQWSDTLPFIQRIINSAYESSINTTPASLLFGNAINLDRGIIMPFAQTTGTTHLSGWVANMIRAQQAALQASKEFQLAKDQQHMANYSALRTEFEPGTYVLISYPISRHSTGATNKLKLNKKGPMKVLTHQGNTYTVENLVTRKQEKYHVTQLSTFHIDETRLDAAAVANHDDGVEVVEQILDHEPKKNNYIGQRVSEMSFKVRWANLPPEYDRWLNWKELRNNSALIQYLRNNNLQRLIPREHRNR